MVIPHGGLHFLEALACEFHFRRAHLAYYPHGKIMICHFDPSYGKGFRCFDVKRFQNKDKLKKIFFKELVKYRRTFLDHSPIVPRQNHSF